MEGWDFGSVFYQFQIVAHYNESFVISQSDQVVVDDGIRQLTIQR